MLCRSSRNTEPSCLRCTPRGLQLCRAPPSQHGGHLLRLRTREGQHSGRSLFAAGMSACRLQWTSTSPPHAPTALVAAGYTKTCVVL